MLLHGGFCMFFRFSLSLAFDIIDIFTPHIH